MTTIICDLSVDWMECPYCSMLNGCVESAESTCRAASERLDQAYADYREERDAGRAAIGTGQWSVWQDRLRYLEQQSTAAHDTWGNAIDEWADCIHTHRRLYEEQQREAGAEPDRTDVSPETEEMPTTQSDGDDTPCTCAMCQAEDGDHTDEERAAYYAERDQCDPDDGEREQSREAARRIIADYMGVDPDDVHIICSGIFGAADEPNQPHEQEQSTLAAIPLAEVKSILAKRKTEYEKFRNSCARRGVPSYGAGWAIGAIKEIRDDIDKLTTTEEATNA